MVIRFFTSQISATCSAFLAKKEQFGDFFDPKSKRAIFWNKKKMNLGKITQTTGGILFYTLQQADMNIIESTI